MTGNSTTIPWSSWSLSTKVAVGFGMVLAAALVVILYLPR
jgi:hypothetical protein